MTLNSALITEVRAITNDTSTNTDLQHLGDTTILQFLQRATNDICIETDINYRAYEYTHTTANKNSVTLVNLTGGAETKLYKLNELSARKGTVQLSLTDVLMTTNGVTVTSVVGGFTSSMVGSYLSIISGTNYTAGLYEIKTYISSNSVTIDSDATSGGNGSVGVCKVVSLNRITPLKRVGNSTNKLIKDNNNTDIISCNIYDDTVYFNSSITAGDVIYISARWKKANLTAGGTFPLDSMGEDSAVKYASSLGYYAQTKETLGKVWFDMFVYRRTIIEKYYKDLIQAQDPGAVRVHKKSNSLGISYPNYGTITE